MYRVFLSLAFLVFCSAAPYGGDPMVTRVFPGPERTFIEPTFEQRDETDLVDSTGSGYSYFRHQPIVARPIEEQRVAVQSFDTLIRTDEKPTEFSDYARSSAFKSLDGPYGSSLNTKIITDDRVILRDGYGKEKFMEPTVKVVNTGYGAPLVEEKTIIKTKPDGYGAKVFTDDRVLIREDFGPKVFRDDRVLVREDFAPKVFTDDRVFLRDGYGKEKFLPPPPAVRVVNNGYGAPLIEEKTIIKAKPDGYGAKVFTDDRVFVRDGYGQDKFMPPPPIVKVANTGYGAPLVEENRVFLRDGYGKEKFLPLPPRVVETGYGKPMIEEKTIIRVTPDTGYGAKVFPVPDTRVFVRDGGYGQDKFIPPPPIVKTRY